MSEGIKKQQMIDLIILGSITEKPMYGYQIKQNIDCMTWYTGISQSSLYSALQKLESKVMLKKESKKEGNRPEKHIFKITQEGKKYMQEILHQLLMYPKMIQEPYNVALTYAKKVDKKIIINSIILRKNQFQKYLNELAKMIKKDPDNILLLRGYYHLKAEVEWAQKALKIMK